MRDNCNCKNSSCKNSSCKCNGNCKCKTKKSEAYLVYISRGAWDDYSASVLKIFLNQNSAEEYAVKKNKQIERLKQMIPSTAFDEYGDLIFESENMRYLNILNLNNCWVMQYEIE